MADANASAQALERYRQTSIAFDDLIVQVGRALARAQEAMDSSQVEFQRRVAQALQEGRVQRLDVAPRSAYTIPLKAIKVRERIPAVTRAMEVSCKGRGTRAKRVLSRTPANRIKARPNPTA